MKQPEEMPDESLKPFGWLAGFYTNICSDCEVHHIAAKRSWRCKECAEKAKVKHDEQPRADLAAKPDKVDVEKLKREAVRWCLANAANMDLEELGNAFIDHLYSRNLIPPVEPVQGDDGNKKEKE